MRTETLSWSGEVMIQLEENGHEYLCDIDVDIELQKWQERHEPGYSEPMNDALVCLGQFEVTSPGGHQVIDRALLKSIRAELVQWVAEHESSIIIQAK